MNAGSIILELCVIVVGAAVLGTIFLYAKQPIIIAYIAVGIVVGPSGFGFIREIDHIEDIAHIGVVLMLFLIGLHLQPRKLIKLFKKTSLLTLITSLLFGTVSFLIALVLKFSMHSAFILGAAMMFSSTIISLKLIPTTTLHQKRAGEIMTSVLLLQDMLAILVILFLTGEKSDYVALSFLLLAGKFVLLCLFAFMGVKFVMIPLLTKFSVVQEYTFLATLAWCLLWAELAHAAGLSYEMGAFVAGISIASCPIALVIAEHLKPLREFFLILFFFAVGARLDLGVDPKLLVGGVVLGAVLVPLKAIIFRLSFLKTGESPELSRELSVRLAQTSEFSILVAFAAISLGLLSDKEAMVIQVATIVTFVISTYWVVMKYPTPISGNDKLRRD